MDDQRLARWRLNVLRLNGSSYSSITDVIDGLLGVQAENYSQTLWALASRARQTFDTEEFQEVFDSGEILRTHVLRPTWHFVRPDDIGWLLELTGPRIRRSLRQIQRELGLSDTDLGTGIEIIREGLVKFPHQTRAQIAEHLVAAGLDVRGQAVGTIIMEAESRAVICSGPMVEGEQTYASLDARAPRTRYLGREESVAELVFRYFSGHGPATERDLSYWASMTLTDIRSGLGEPDDRLDSFDHDDRTFWYTEPEPQDLDIEPRGHLLLTLDEYHNGYQDSRAVLDIERIVPPGRPKNVGMALVDSQMVGGMRRFVGTDRVRFEVNPFRTLTPDERGVLLEAAQRYGDFLDLEPQLIFT